MIGLFFQLSGSSFRRDCLKKVRSCMKDAEKCGLDDLMDIKVRYELSNKFNATAWFMMTKYNVLVPSVSAEHPMYAAIWYDYFEELQELLKSDNLDEARELGLRYNSRMRHFNNEQNK